MMNRLLLVKRGSRCSFILGCMLSFLEYLLKKIEQLSNWLGNKWGVKIQMIETSKLWDKWKAKTS